jgi:DNA mismatch endonuclease (patch repair protein)
MSTARRAHTEPEKALRSELFARGLRFRIQVPLEFDRRRRADITFPRQRVVVFVDGCFWHVCPEHATWPKANAAWWKSKLLANQARDRDTDARLRRLGWHVIRVWEHEDIAGAADTVEAAVRAAPEARRA